MKTIGISKPVHDHDEHSVSLSGGSTLVRKEEVYTKFFSRGHFISIRPICISRDMPFIASRIVRKSGGSNFNGPPLHLLAAAYMYMGASSFIRAFTCLLNRRIPIDVIEISDMYYSELGLCDGLESGDFSITIPFGTGRKKLNLLRTIGLQTCLEYFFSFPEIKRIICAPYKDDKDIIELLLKSGFWFTPKITGRNDLLNFYCCTRETFMATK